MCKDTQESGLTLIELLVSMTLTSILLGSGYSLFTSQTRAYSLTEQVLEMQGNARFALDTIVRDLQMAGYDRQKEEIFGVTAYQANNFPSNSRKDSPVLSLGTNYTELYFTRDSIDLPEEPPPNGVIDNNGSERFGFRVNTGSLESAFISPADGSIASWQVVTANIESMAVSYTYANGTVSSGTTNLPDNNIPDRYFRDVMGITLTLAAKTSLKDPKYTHPTEGDHFRRMTLTAEVFPRNLGF